MDDDVTAAGAMREMGLHRVQGGPFDFLTRPVDPAPWFEVGDRVTIRMGDREWMGKVSEVAPGTVTRIELREVWR